MPFGNITSLGNQALQNYDADAMARFQGNENVPIEANISAEKFIGALQDTASGNSQAHSEAKQLLGHLAEEHGGWNISAGIHEGGIGGNGFGADPNKHITTSTGHHVQLNEDGVIKKITGNGIENRRTQLTGPSGTENELGRLKNQYGLNDKEAAKARLLQQHGDDNRRYTEEQAVKKVISDRRK